MKEDDTWGDCKRANKGGPNVRELVIQSRKDRHREEDVQHTAVERRGDQILQRRVRNQE